MLRQMISIRVGFLVCLTAMLALLPGFTVSAEDIVRPEKESCVACHEDHYYLHDTGKWFCLCTEKMRCTCCHGGDPMVKQADAAHKDMVLFPALKDGAICQGCHAQDYQARVEQFATVAGISQFPPREFLYTPAAVSSAEVQSISIFPSRLRQPWRLVGISVTLLLLLCSLTFVSFHWRNNHPVKHTPEGDDKIHV